MVVDGDTKLGNALNGDVPGTWSQVSRTGLAELSTNASNGDASYDDLNRAVQTLPYDK